jgi:tetrahydromethanopterin S-methyltransferase subunit G
MYEEEIYKIHDRLERLEQKLEMALDRLNNKIDEKFELMIKLLTKGSF